MTNFDPAATLQEARLLLAIAGPDHEAPTHVLVLRWALGDYCTIPECPGTHKALGLCAAHYVAHRRATRNQDYAINRKATRGAA